MKRLVIAIIIFSLTISFCISSFFILTRRGEQMIDTISCGITEAENDAELTQVAQKINKEWSKNSTLFKSVFIHDDFSEIEALIDKLNVFATQNSVDSFIECCYEAISRIRFVLDNEKPEIRNIF